jgi:hypothetical protein
MKDGELPANHKRVYRLMKQHNLMLETSRPGPGRTHDGKVVVMRSSLRWCPDGFEFACWNGEIMRVGFVIDTHGNSPSGAPSAAAGSVARRCAT